MFYLIFLGIHQELNVDKPIYTNYNIYKFYDSDEAIKCIDTVKLDCAILDVMIKGKN